MKHNKTKQESKRKQTLHCRAAQYCHHLIQSVHFLNVLLLLCQRPESLLTYFALVRVDLFVHCPFMHQTIATHIEALFAKSA